MKKKKIILHLIEEIEELDEQFECMDSRIEELEIENYELREENKRLTDIFSPINENYTIPMEITIWANKEYELEDLAKPLMTYIEQR